MMYRTLYLTLVRYFLQYTVAYKGFFDHRMTKHYSIVTSNSTSTYIVYAILQRKVSTICGHFYIAQNPSRPSEIIYKVKKIVKTSAAPPLKLTGKKVTLFTEHLTTRIITYEIQGTELYLINVNQFTQFFLIYITSFIYSVLAPSTSSVPLATTEFRIGRRAEILHLC